MLEESGNFCVKMTQNKSIDASRYVAYRMPAAMWRVKSKKIAKRLVQIFFFFLPYECWVMAFADGTEWKKIVK